MASMRAPLAYQRFGRDGEHEDDIELRRVSGLDSGEYHGIEAIDRIQHLTAERTMPSRKAMSDQDLLLPPVDSAQEQLEMPTKQPFFSGWRVGVLVSLIGAVTVLVFNFVITIWVSTSPSHSIENSNGILFRGSCNAVRRWNIWMHILVNSVSTLLLSASNYCMQVLSAPNRAELDHAHAKRYWLNIGVPNARNLKHIGRKRVVLWTLLGLSSIPLHFLFNSVVFTNLQTNSYAVIPTTQGWLQGNGYDTSSFLTGPGFNSTPITTVIDRYRPNLTEKIGHRAEKSRYINMSTAECFSNYDKQYISDFGTVYLIQDSPTVWRDPSVWALLRNDTGEFLWAPESERNKTSKKFSEAKYANYTEQAVIGFPFHSLPDSKQFTTTAWMCHSKTTKNCTVNNAFEVPNNRSLWMPYGRRVLYCMVEQVEPKFCRLQFNLPIAWTVIISNLVKVVCMAITLLAFQDHGALVTVGDVVASCLENPDQETRNRCLCSRQNFEDEWSSKSAYSKISADKWNKKLKYNPKKRRWVTAVHLDRWIWTYATYFVALLIAVPSIHLSQKNMSRDFTTLWKVGFGTMSGNNLLETTFPLVNGVILGNTPQVLLSYMYMAFNALYTNMFVAQEFSSYQNKRKALRVTAPQGLQRGTYWLNIPYRYAIPLTIVSGIFHWLASQSFFMVQLTITNEQHEVERQVSTCGFSPIAIILTLIVGSIIAGCGVIASQFRYGGGMPVASSCSAAITAACHPLPEDTNASLSTLQWGAVSHGATDTDEAGHCCFSSFPVETPIAGRCYA